VLTGEPAFGARTHLGASHAGRPRMPGAHRRRQDGDPGARGGQGLHAAGPDQSPAGTFASTRLMSNPLPKGISLESPDSLRRCDRGLHDNPYVPRHVRHARSRQGHRVHPQRRLHSIVGDFIASWAFEHPDGLCLPTTTPRANEKFLLATPPGHRIDIRFLKTLRLLERSPRLTEERMGSPGAMSDVLV